MTDTEVRQMSMMYFQKANIYQYLTGFNEPFQGDLFWHEDDKIIEVQNLHQIDVDNIISVYLALKKIGVTGFYHEDKSLFIPIDETLKAKMVNKEALFTIEEIREITKAIKEQKLQNGLKNYFLRYFKAY